MPVMAAAYAAMRPETVPRATSGSNVMQRVGGSIGGAVLAVILNAQLLWLTLAAIPAAVVLARQERRAREAAQELHSATARQASSRSTADPVGTCWVP